MNLTVVRIAKSGDYKHQRDSSTGNHKCHGNPFDISEDISVWTKAADRLTRRPVFFFSHAAKPKKIMCHEIRQLFVQQVLAARSP